MVTLITVPLRRRFARRFELGDQFANLDFTLAGDACGVEYGDLRRGPADSAQTDLYRACEKTLLNIGVMGAAGATAFAENGRKAKDRGDHVWTS